MFQEAVDVCRAGLSVHPAYLSARVTLGRALIELQQFDAAQLELEHVLHSAPENLAAIRGLADALHHQGAWREALQQYRAALTLVRHDPDLEQTIADLEAKVPPDVSVQDTTVAPADRVVDHAPARALAAVAALEQLLTAVHVVRAQRHA